MIEVVVTKAIASTTSCFVEEEGVFQFSSSTNVAAHASSLMVIVITFGCCEIITFDFSVQSDP
ncbi:MAG: hypothetical protein ACPLIG_04730 [Candidatus Bathyarchaeales archaeon]